MNLVTAKRAEPVESPDRGVGRVRREWKEGEEGREENDMLIHSFTHSLISSLYRV